MRVDLSSQWLVVIVSVAPAVLLGCVNFPTGDPQLLTFLEDGSTTREDTYLRLAEPHAVLEGGSILIYQLDQDEHGYVLMKRRQNAWAGRYSLVLTFDEKGVLKRHSLVKIKDSPLISP